MSDGSRVEVLRDVLEAFTGNDTLRGGPGLLRGLPQDPAPKRLHLPGKRQDNAPGGVVRRGIDDDQFRWNDALHAKRFQRSRQNVGAAHGRHDAGDRRRSNLLHFMVLSANPPSRR